MPAPAQITPDQTLGVESSIVMPNVEVRDELADVIEGGAERGTNLFHSFSEFNIDAGQRVYFLSPAGIENIFSRVTGDDVTTIRGLLGTTGDSVADLFLMNPNGILFEGNASLDVQGAFTATTASGIELGDIGLFNAVSPENDRLLDIQPSAFFFSNLVEQGDIQVLAQNENSLNLRVPIGEQLLILGRNIQIDNGRLDAWEGRVDLIAANDEGRVEINEGALSVPDNIERGDITLENFTTIDAQLAESGDIHLAADNIILSNAQLLAGIEEGFGPGSRQAGDIEIDSAGAVIISGEFTLLTSEVESEALGQAGDIRIRASSLDVRDGAQINASISGIGNAGNIAIEVDELASFSGETLGGEFPSGVFSSVFSNGQGRAGDILIRAGSLDVRDGAQINSSVFGIGDAGNIFIEADELASFSGEALEGGGLSGAFSRIFDGGQGKGGEVVIRAGSLDVRNGAQISASTSGIGDAGDISINVNELASFSGEDSEGFPSEVSSSVFDNGLGQGGTIEIRAGRLDVRNGARISASTSGIGDAGDISINVNELASFSGESSDGLFPSSLDSNVFDDGLGQGGTIEIRAGRLDVRNGARISASTSGMGDAGDIFIDVNELASFSGEDLEGLFPSRIDSSVFDDGRGQGGTIEIRADRLEILDGAQISASTSGLGDAGTLNISVEDTFQAENATVEAISRPSENFSSFDSGQINITAGGIVLFGDSDIQTKDFSFGENLSLGGDIAIETGYIIAFDDSDIVVDTDSGNLSLDAEFFAETPDPFNTTAISADEVENNDRVDVFVRGNRSTIGDSAISRNISGNELSEDLINSDILINSGCNYNINTEEGYLTISPGAGSLSSQSGNLMFTPYLTGAVQALSPNTASIPQYIPTNTSPPINAEEPQAIHQLPDGRLLMARNCQ